MSTLIEKMQEQRKSLLDQAGEIAQRGIDAGKPLSAEDGAKFDGLTAEVEALDKRMKEISEGEQRARDIEESFRKNHPDAQRRGEAGEANDSPFTQWVREVRNGGPQGFDLLPEVGVAQRAVDHRGEQRAMSATGGVGKAGVYGQLWEYAVDASQILQAGVTIIETTDGNTLPLPVVTAHAAAASAAANAPITASDSVITTVDLSAVKQGFITYVPNELLSDATFDVEGYIARNAGRALGNKISAVAAAAVTAGFTASGATGPTGTASGTFGNQATAGQGFDLLIKLFHSVLPAYRTGASWLMGDSVAALVRSFKTSQGDYVWSPSITPGDPDLILGRSWFVDPNLPGFAGVPATDSGAKVIYFGDFSALAVRIAGGLRFERSTEAGFANDQTAFRALVRTGAAVTDLNAVKYFAFA